MSANIALCASVFSPSVTLIFASASLLIHMCSALMECVCLCACGCIDQCVSTGIIPPCPCPFFLFFLRLLFAFLETEMSCYGDGDTCVQKKNKLKKKGSGGERRETCGCQETLFLSSDQEVEAEGASFFLSLQMLIIIIKEKALNQDPLTCVCVQRGRV